MDFLESVCIKDVYMLKLLRRELQVIRETGLYRHMREVTGPQGSRMTVDGANVLAFCSNDYLGLASHPEVCQAAVECINRYGFGAGASRLISGNMSLNRELEEALADFKQEEKALVFSSGTMANTGIISAVVEKEDCVIIDRFNHASIVDGCILSGARMLVYPHRDTNRLEDILKKIHSRYRRKLIVTDSVFSMEGDIAPLPDILELGDRYDASVMIDEAHATGVLGECGRGVKEYFRLGQGAGIVMGTLGKALGSFGGFVAGDASLIDFLVNRSRSFVYTTGLPPAVCAAALAGLGVLQQEPDRLQRLKANAQYLRDELKQMTILGHETPILPLLTRDSETALMLSHKLWHRGVWVPAIRPPTVSREGARLRIAVSSEHTKADMDYLIAALEEIMNQ